MRKLKYFILGRLFPCILLLLGYTACFVLFFAVRLPALLAATWAAERAFSLVAALFIAACDDLFEVRFSKLILLLFLPWLGAVFALFSTKRRNSVPPVRQERFEDEKFERLCRAANSPLAASTVRSAEFFSVGKSFLLKLLNDLDSAREYVYLEFYIIDGGTFRDAVFSVLSQKAKAGVKIYLLYDDFGCALTLPRNYFRQLRANGILAKPFGKIRYPSLSLNRRDHRKCVVIDGKTAYVGGMNLADEYVGESVRFGHWKDSAMRLTGGAAGAFAEMFERHWNDAFPKEKIPVRARVTSDGEISCLPVCSKPCEGKNGAFYRLLYALLTRVERRIYLTTPYLAPDEGLLFALEQAARCGADVRILIPHVPDKKTVFLLSRYFARKLLSNGVQVREYEAGFLHAKNVVCDGEYALVSSCNLDMRSLRLQYECGALVKCREVGREVERDFLSAWEQSVPVPKPRRGEGAIANLLKPFLPLL